MKLIKPEWTVPRHIQAFTTTRNGGTSEPPYHSLNLGDHVADNPENVATNRQLVTMQAHLPESPRWLRQVHGTRVINSKDWSLNYEADAIISQQQNHVCTVLTADCLPVLLTDKAGTEIAAIHAGWRGLAGGIIENTVQQMKASSSSLAAWLGPAIGPQQFEVGIDVYNAFVGHDSMASQAFQAVDEEHFLADIYLLARLRLADLGIDSVYGGHWCTVSQAGDFFSYRRDGETGRMATMIWIDDK